MTREDPRRSILHNLGRGKTKRFKEFNLFCSGLWLGLFQGEQGPGVGGNAPQSTPLPAGGGQWGSLIARNLIVAVKCEKIKIWEGKKP